jgi:hypothetical protein
MSDLETRFKKAVHLIRNGPPKSSDNETKLSFYKVRRDSAQEIIAAMRETDRQREGGRGRYDGKREMCILSRRRGEERERERDKTKEIFHLSSPLSFLRISRENNISSIIQSP